MFINEMIRLEKASQTTHDYNSYHEPRVQFVFDLCKAMAPSQHSRVLDIGRSKLSFNLAGYYNEVATLGFPLPPSHENSPLKHLIFDLNNSQTMECFEGEQQSFDLIVFAEVIEHIYTAPELVLNFLKSLLKPNGIIICQTPNAAALHKRIKLLLGFNPYERIRFDNKNPGHFREYTKQELIEIGTQAGLEIIEHRYVDYFSVYGNLQQRLAIRALKLASKGIASLARGQTIVYRNQYNNPKR